MKSKYKYNKSTYFLLPLLEIPFYELNQAKGCYVNSYCRLDTTEQQLQDLGITVPQRFSLYVLIDRSGFDTDALYFALDQGERTHKTLKIKLVSKDHILLGYEFYDFLVEYDLFKVGKYSRFGERAKTTIQEYVSPTITSQHTGAEENNENYFSLYPTEESRRSLGLLLGVSLDPEAEVLSPPNMEHETIEFEFKMFKVF